nr:chalcone isomerase family protein [Vibrio agarilyticus]
MTWFVFDVYQSRLKTPNGRYIISRDITPHPLALEINYQREISSEQLLEATDDQWQKLGLTAQQRQRGLARFRALFPTVQPGDQLTYVTDGQLGALYFSQGTDVALLGYIEQEWLNDAFLAIWLSPKTAYPKLRQQLIAER